jgi:outer membrane protein assembly factor BamB
VLNEKDGEVRLLCLQPKDHNERRPPAPDIVWIKSLANAKESFNLDFNRRMHAAHLACGSGFLVCPTNAGTIFGVDLVTHGVWAYQYRTEAPVVNGKAAPPYLVHEWKATAPAIHDDKVFFAGPDSLGIHCVNLRDGREVWQKPRAADDLYFAGTFADKVVLVGKSYVRALNVATGAEVWKLATGTPSGQGVAGDNVYYLPVRAGVEPHKGPGIVAISLTKGAVVGFTRAIDQNGRVDIPGNLIFHDGQLLSQNLTSLVCYPRKSGD